MLATLAAGWTLGCAPMGGCGKPREQTSNQPGASTSVSEVAVVGTSETRGPVLEFSLQALAARFEAQKRLLGSRGVLFEDEQGRPIVPVRPPIEDATEPDMAQNVEDALLEALPGSSGIGFTRPAVGVATNGNALGLYVPIADPSDGGEALAWFHEAIRKLAHGTDADGKVRVLVYGASHTAADVYTNYLRSYLQARFGDAGHGFIQLAKINKSYRHLDVTVESSNGWRTEHAQKRDGRTDGFYGLLGASLSSSRRKDWGRVVPSPTIGPGHTGSLYDIYYLAQPAGGSFKLWLDGKQVAKVSTRGDTFGPGYHTIRVSEGSHVLELRPHGDGEVRLFGVAIEREQNGIVLDTLGINGTRAANHLAWDEAIWADNIRRRSPDLYVLAYGTNEAGDDDQPITLYEAELRAVLERFQRAVPNASCVLVGPGDFPRVLEGSGYAPRPRTSQIVAVQRAVSSDMGCGFWDMLSFMGGEMSMPMWVAAQPQMARNDFLHLSKRGYVRMGMALTDALMVDYDGELAGPGTTLLAGP